MNFFLPTHDNVNKGRPGVMMPRASLLTQPTLCT